MKRCWTAVVVVWLCQPLWAQPAWLDCGVVPGWEPRGTSETYEPDNLFDYMNGNAEGYLIYDFRRLWTITCTSGERRIVIDASEMGSPEMAYGLFLSARHPDFPLEDLGMAGQITPRRAAFSKGTFYVEFMGSGAEDMTEDLRAFAESLSTRVPGDETPPRELGWLPDEDRIEGSLRLVPQSVLGLHFLRFGYVADYGFGRLFLVRETSPEAMRAAYEQLAERLDDRRDVTCGEAGLEGRDRYLGEIRICLKGRYLAGVAAVKDRERAGVVLQELLSRIP